MRTFQVEVWVDGSLMLRTESTDDVVRAVKQGRYLQWACLNGGVTIVDNNHRTFQQYEWPDVTGKNI